MLIEEEQKGCITGYKKRSLNALQSMKHMHLSQNSVHCGTLCIDAESFADGWSQINKLEKN